MSRQENDYILSIIKLAFLALFLCLLVVSCGEQDDDVIVLTVDFSGKVALNNGTAMVDVNINLKDTINNSVTIETALTALDGTYRFEGLTPSKWYTIEPSIGGYSFHPEQIQVYTNVNLTNADFEGNPD
jgi:hypothetical protein